MRLSSTVMPLLLAMPLLAGDVLVGSCGICGHTTEEVFHGVGRMPGYVREVYEASASGLPCTVLFDLVERTAAERGCGDGDTEAGPPSGEHREAIIEAMSTFEPDSLLTPAEGDGLSFWVYLQDEAGCPGDTLLLVPDPVSATFTCPGCGAEDLRFVTVGVWD